jgi:hypothetical protein
MGGCVGWYPPAPVEVQERDSGNPEHDYTRRDLSECTGRPYKKFGFKPLEATLKQQNVYGARWNKTSSDWNGTKVSGLLENDENPSDPTLTFLLVLNSDGETIKTTNPLD